MATFWDEVKDLFKTKKQKDEEKSEALKNALESEKGITEQLENLDKEYKANKYDYADEIAELFPENLGLEKIDYSVESDDEIQSRAKSESDAKRAQKTGDIEEKYSDQLDEYIAKKQGAESSAKEKEKDLENLYAELKEKQKNASIKKGVNRGSILSSLISQISANENADVEKVQKAYADTVDAIDMQIKSLDDARENALEELDLTLASELKDKIAKLKSERDKTVASYVKYNNSVEEKERAYATKRAENIEDFLAKKETEEKEREEKYGYSGDKLDNYSKRYNIAYDFYMSMSPEIAASALDASPNMRYYLGQYYDKLMSELEKRGNSVKKYY